MPLLKPLYELSDPGNYWESKMKRHLKHDLRIEKAALDINIFYLRRNEKIIEMSSMYVDDGIHAGLNEFLKKCDKN